MRGKSTTQAIQQLNRFVTRATKETRSKEDALARIVIAKAGSLLSVRGKQYFNSRRVQTLMDLRESLQSWEATEGVLFAQERLSRPTCFKCGKLGHRAADCYTRTTTSHESSKKDGHTIISCFACGQPGHKCPDCHNKADSKLKDSDSKKKDSRKALRNN